jgi:hypothetical protein
MLAEENKTIITEENKKIVLDFFENFSSGNVDALLAAMADTATWQILGSIPLAGTRTKQEFGESFKALAPIIPKGVKITPKGITAEGERVALEADAYGELVNGKVYHNQLHVLVEVRDGKIQAVREYFDTMHVNDVFGS